MDMGIIDKMLNRFGYELYVKPVEEILDSKGRQEFEKYPWIYRAHVRKKEENILGEIETRFKDEFVPYIISLQNDNGSFPWGYKKIEHNENVDTTASVVLSLRNYDDERARKIVKKSGEYLEGQLANHKARLNPWLGYQEDLGILGLVTEAVAKLYGSDLPVVSSEMKFIDNDINTSGEPRTAEKYRMQNKLGAAFKVLRAYASTGRKDSEKATSVKNFILRQQKDGHFDIDVSWSDPIYKLYSMTGAIKSELTAEFVDTFVSELGYSPKSKDISKAVDYICKDRFLESMAMRKVPTSVVGHVNSILIANPSYKLDVIKNNFPHLYRSLVHVLRMPIGSNIEQDIGRAGSLLKLLNIVKSRG